MKSKEVRKYILNVYETKMKRKQVKKDFNCLLR